MSIRSVFIGFKYPHHGKYSGYDRIADYLAYDLILHADRHWFFGRLHKFAYRHKPLMLGKYTLCDPLQFFYRSFRVWTRWRCAFIRNAVFHFAYPETGIVFNSVPGGKNNGFVASIHLPAKSIPYLHQRIIDRMKKLDHLILMSEDMFDGLQQIFPGMPMTWLPHGVDTEYFSPGNEAGRNVDILLLGNWLRDFEFASGVFNVLTEAEPKLSLQAVALPENLALLKDIPGLQCRENITDDELRDLLRRTRILFLPLKDFTANNAILEAAASGCRICLALKEAIVVNGYFDNYTEILPWDAQQVALKLRDFLAAPAPDTGELLAYTRERYGWAKVAAATASILKSSLL